MLAASMAVGIAVTIMYYAWCTHPTGGATALGAVIGGPAVHELGFQFVITPVLLNVIVIIFIGIAFNALFKWRRYPVSIYLFSDQSGKEKEETKLTSLSPITHEGFVYALSQIDTLIDVDESDLLRIYELATDQSQNIDTGVLQLKKNSFFSNGEFGAQWSVR